MIRNFLNKEYIYARFGSHRLFWRIRSIFLNKNFEILRSIFRLQINIESAREETSAIKELLKNAKSSIIGVLLITICICLFEYHINTIAELDFIRDSVIGEYLLRQLDSSTYTQLLIIVATIAGVFLGLYFTAITAVITNMYSIVPNNIKQLFIRDKLGNTYIRILSLSVALSVVMLVMNLIYIYPFHLLPIVLAFLSVSSVVAFIQLGKRAFFLSDSIFMASELSNDIRRWIRRSTYKGWRWNDPNFQEHYYKRASKSISTLIALTTISRRESKLKENSHYILIANITAIICYYLSLKHLIPSDSRWFGKKLQYEQWYLTESTELERASKGDITLQPKELPDISWLEDELLEAIILGLEEYATIDDKESLYKQLSLLTNLFNDMGEHWSIKDGQKWCNRITDKIFMKVVIEKSQAKGVQLEYSIAITDICASLPIRLELGLMKAIDTLKIEDFRKKLIKNNWARDSSPYRFSMPLNVVKALEEIRDSTAFEQVSKISYEAPCWYIIEIASNNIDWALFNCWNIIRSLVESWYAETGRKLSDEKLFMQAAAVYMRAIEFAWKLDRHIESLEKTSKALREGAILDLNRPKWEWNKEKEFVTKFRDESTEEIAKLIPNLFPETIDPNLPDYFGGAVHKTGESCFDALMKGNVRRFRILFQFYFKGILGVFDQVHSQVVKWKEPSKALVWISEPIIDLFETSGYSFMLAEFHNKPKIWQITKEIWDEYLSQDQEKRLKLMAELSFHYYKKHIISPRATLRVQRQFRFRDLLKELPRQEGDSSELFFKPPVKHSSRFIRFIAPRDDLLLPDAIEVFIVMYLMRLPAAANIDFGVREANVRYMQGDRE